MTSAPKGCCRFSIERTATGRAGGEVEQRRDDRRGAEVEGDGEAARRWCRRARRAISTSSTTTAVTFQSALRSARGSVAQHAERDARRRGPRCASARRSASLRWSVRRRLVQLEVALDDGRAQDHLAADADRRGLRAAWPAAARRRRRSVTACARQASRQPSRSSSGVKTRASSFVDRQVADVDAHAALLAGAVRAAGGVDRDAVPGRGVEQRHARRHAHLDPARLEAEPDAAGAPSAGVGGLDRRHARRRGRHRRAVVADPVGAPLVLAEQDVRRRAPPPRSAACGRP